MSNIATAVPSNPGLTGIIVWSIVSVVGGGVLALVATFGVVNAVGALPPAVDAPYVVYGTQ